jgi:hypothetical protein
LLPSPKKKTLANTRFTRVYKLMGLVYYDLAAILNVLIAVLVLFVFEVTVTLTVDKTPGDKLLMVTALEAAVLLVKLLVKITVFSAASLVTLTSIVTPSVGKVVVIFTLITCEPPMAP